MMSDRMHSVWESEEWLKTFAKPLDKSGGMSIFLSSPRVWNSHVLVSGAALRAKTREGAESTGDQNEDEEDNAMVE